MRVVRAIKSYWRHSRAIQRLYRNPLKRAENLPLKDRVEREFYDAEARPYLDNFDPDRFRYDEDEDMPASYRRFYSALTDVAGKNVLDICCGYGITAVRCAKKGARVTGIDLSPNMIALAGKNAELNSVADRIDLIRMSAHAMSFDEDVFDYVVGIGALHHLNLELSGREISRVLKPGGTAIFLEPLIPFKWMLVLRSFFPHKCFESPGGGGLTHSEIDVFTRNFRSHSRAPYLFLRKLARVPIINRHADRLDYIDQRLLRIFPFLARIYWAAVLEFHKEGHPESPSATRMT